MLSNYVITCAVNTRSEKQETESCHDRRVAEQSFIQDGEVPWNLNPSGLGHSISSEACVCDNLEQVR